MAARSQRIDALRGLAVFGIMLVNVWGFVYGFSLYHYSAEVLSGADKLAVFLVAGFAEQKFYPIFSFLFGAGFALQTGPRRAPSPALDAIKATYLRRLTWLLWCGLLHGCLLWFGDILFAYSLTGFWLVRKAGKPLAELVRSLRVLLVVNGIIMVLYVAGSIYAFDASMENMPAQLAEMKAEFEGFTQGSWTDAAVLRLQNFGINVATLVMFIPRLALLFLLGVFAVRLGWLTRPERHRAVWRKVLLAGLAVGLPFNLLWAAMATADLVDPLHPAPGFAFMAAMLDVGGPLLAAAIVASFMLGRERAGAWLAPVGRMALTNYLSQSVLLMLLLQGFGLGLGAVLSHTALVALCVAIMLMQLLWSRWWLSNHTQGPMEALWRRYTVAA